MSREDVQYWLLPVDENNLRCQAAGYRSLKDYLVSNGLKLCKWKETGLIKELNTPSGTKMQFGRYVQYSKIGVKASDYSRKVDKLYESEMTFKPSERSGIRDFRRMSGNTLTQRVQSAYVYRKGGKMDLSFGQQRPITCLTTLREGSHSRNNSLTTNTNQNSSINMTEKQDRLNTPKNRPQSERPFSANKTVVYPLRRAKTIYVSTAAGLAVASVSADTNVKASKNESPKQISKAISSSKKKAVNIKSVTNKYVNSSTELDNSPDKVRAACNSDRNKISSAEKPVSQLKVTCLFIEKKGSNSLRHPSTSCLTEKENTDTVDSKSHDMGEIKSDTTEGFDNIPAPVEFGEYDTQSASTKPKGSSTTAISTKSMSMPANSTRSSTMSMPTQPEESIPPQTSEDKIKPSASEPEVETIILHRNLCTVSSEEIKEADLINVEYLQNVQHNEGEILHNVPSLKNGEEINVVVNLYTANHNTEKSPSESEGNIEASTINGLVQDSLKADSDNIDAKTCPDETSLDLDPEIGQTSKPEGSSGIFRDQGSAFVEKRASSGSLPVCSGSHTSTNSSTYVTPTGSESNLTF